MLTCSQGHGCDIQQEARLWDADSAGDEMGWERFGAPWSTGGFFLGRHAAEGKNKACSTRRLKIFARPILLVHKSCSSWKRPRSTRLFSMKRSAKEALIYSGRIYSDERGQ